jgi:hypothetical protein
VSYVPEDEWPHKADPDPNWQESAYVCWFDHRAGIAGFHRIGHQVGNGTAMAWCGIVTTDGTRFRKVASNLPLSPGDREGGFGAGPGQFIRIVDSQPRIEVDEPDLSLRLQGRDFYPVRDLWVGEASRPLSEKVATGHFESSGRYTGTIRLGDRELSIDAVGHRDRSWGVRRWEYLNSHRWCAGTFGPQLSFSCFTWHAEDGSYFNGGFLVRDGKGIHAESVDIALWIEPDGLTFRGGEIVFRLPSGETLEITCRTIDGIVFDFRNVWEFEAACTVTCGNLTGGFAALEATNNARRGTVRPSSILRGTMKDGLSKRE